ncbi:MAG: hypothetical protein MK108_15920 [Mariniblastus sp.]|nr:hypothetical protein [Mariniblastus sp.]
MSINFPGFVATPLNLFPSVEPGIRLATTEHFCEKTARIVEMQAGLTLPLRNFPYCIELIVIRGECDIQLADNSILLDAHQRCCLPPKKMIHVKALSDLRMIWISEENTTAGPQLCLKLPRDNDMDADRC